MHSFKEKEYNKRFDPKLWKKMLSFCKPYRKSLFALSFFMLLLASIDAAFPLLSKYAIDHFVVPAETKGLMKFAIIYLAIIIIQALNIYFFIKLAGKIEMNLTYDIRKAGFHHLQELSLSYYNKTPVGWLMARMTSDSQRLGSFISWGLVDLVWGFTLMLLIAILMMVMNWKLALLALLVVPILILMSVYFQKKILKAYRRVRKTNSKITGAFNEGISGAKTTKTLVRESRNLEEFQLETGEMYRASVKAAIFSAFYLPAVLSLGSLGTGIVLWLGGKSVQMQAISYGTFVAFISYTVQFFEPLRELARIFAELQNAQASGERIFSMLDEKLDIKDSEIIRKKFGDILFPKTKNWPQIKGEIEFRNVTFSYEKGKNVLTNFDLQIRAGETVAIVGETGSGKSTLVNLACRFFEPDSGLILIDGIDYRQRSLSWLHSNLGYVLQTPHLFSGNIKENIAYGKNNVEQSKIEQTAKMVNAHEFISRLKKGYETEVGEGGANLSTGQKQLISFARAIFTDPKIFVLDEATSSVDTETERLIQDAIQKVLKTRTSFIIAHRLSTIRAADRIFVMRNGKIEETGDHHELIKLKGYYYRLYTNQFMEEEEGKILQEEIQDDKKSKNKGVAS